MSANEEVEWIVTDVRGQQFRKVREVRVGDLVLTSDKSSKESSKQTLPRAWIRMLQSHCLLSELSVTNIQFYFAFFFVFVFVFLFCFKCVNIKKRSQKMN